MTLLVCSLHSKDYSVNNTGFVTDHLLPPDTLTSELSVLTAAVRNSPCQVGESLAQGPQRLHLYSVAVSY